jgi:hypothetical protein
MPYWAVKNMKSFKPVFWLQYLDNSCSVEYIYGDADRISPPEEGEYMADATCSKVCVTVLEGSGHPTGENASETVFLCALNQSLNRIWNRKGEC